MELSTGTIIFLVYLHGLVGSVKMIAFVGLVVLAIVAFAAFLAIFCENQWDENATKWAKRCATTAVVLTSIAIFVPSKSTFENILVAYGIAEIVQTETVKKAASATSETAGKVIDLLNKKIDEQLDAPVEK